MAGDSLFALSGSKCNVSPGMRLFREIADRGLHIDPLVIPNIDNRLVLVRRRFYSTDRLATLASSTSRTFRVSMFIE